MVDQSGIITTIAGTGEPGFAGDGGPAIKAKLNRPKGLAFIVAGNLYSADRNNFRISMVDRNGVMTNRRYRGWRSPGRYHGGRACPLDLP